MNTLPSAWPASLIQDLDVLRHRLHARRSAIVPVIGSGLSHDLKSWPAFIGDLIARVSDPGLQQELRDLAAKDQWYAVSSGLVQELGEPEVQTRIRDIYDTRQPRPATYDALVALPCDGFVTTNWDGRIAAALTARDGVQPLRVVPTLTATLGSIPRVEPWVFEAHGRADLAEPCFLTNQHLARLRTDPAWRGAMERVFGGTCLFLGYSLEDHHVRAMLEDARAIHGPGAPLRHWWLGVTRGKVHRRALTDLDMRVVDYEDHGRLPTILSWLAQVP